MVSLLGDEKDRHLTVRHCGRKFGSEVPSNLSSSAVVSLLRGKLAAQPHVSPVWETPPNSIGSDRPHMQGRPGNPSSEFSGWFSGEGHAVSHL